MNGNNKSVAYLLIAVLAIIWGSSFILMKRGLDVYTPYQIGALRMLVSFIAMFPFVFNSFRKIERSKWKYLALAGILGNGIPSILFPLAETKISSALAGMLNSLTPLFTMIIGIVIYRINPGKQKIYGLLIGLLGAILLIVGRSPDSISGDISFSLIVVVATICYAACINIIRHNLATIDSLRTTGFALLFAGLPMGVYLFFTDFVKRSQEIPGSGFSMFCIIVLGLFGTAISTVLFNRLIKLNGALSASSVTYLIPIVSTIWGVFDNEKILPMHIIGLCAILSGIYLINRSTVKSVVNSN